ncbi:MAG: hypothetical protein CM1200mP24_03270 [Gammaproteobacteria bacterium]|nr:MAG: hypothetical protein CM1200mP24_03270 [Gammaproteobacteria bacterium]
MERDGKLGHGRVTDVHFYGLLLDRSGIANRLMTSFARIFGRVNGGLAITVT